MTILQILSSTEVNALIDSLAKTTTKADYLELINKVDGFYNSAWIKLVVYLGFANLAIPFFLYFIQKHFKDDFKDYFNAQLINEVNRISIEQKGITEAKFEELRSNFLQEKEVFQNKMCDTINVIRHNAEAVGYHLQSDLYFEKNDFKSSYENYITTLICCVVGKDKSNFTIAFNSLKKTLKHINKENIEHSNYESSKYSNIEFLIYLLEKNKDNIDFSKEIKTLEEYLKSQNYIKYYSKEILEIQLKELYTYKPF